MKIVPAGKNREQKATGLWHSGPAAPQEKAERKAGAGKAEH
jgi:hypothetical protein